MADWMEDLTWKCDICHTERPDAKISVYKVNIGPAIRNVKYCNDNPKCLEGAEHWTKERVA